MVVDVTAQNNKDKYVIQIKNNNEEYDSSLKKTTKDTVENLMKFSDVLEKERKAATKAMNSHDRAVYGVQSLIKVAGGLIGLSGGTVGGGIIKGVVGGVTASNSVNTYVEKWVSKADGTYGTAEGGQALEKAEGNYKNEPSGHNIEVLRSTVMSNRNNFKKLDENIKNSKNRIDNLQSDKQKLEGITQTVATLEQAYRNRKDLPRNASEYQKYKDIIKENEDKLKKLGFEDYVGGNAYGYGAVSRRLQGEIDKKSEEIKAEQKYLEENQKNNQAYYTAEVALAKAEYSSKNAGKNFDSDLARWTTLKDMSDKSEELEKEFQDLTTRMRDPIEKVENLNQKISEVPEEVRCNVGVFVNTYNQNNPSNPIGSKKGGSSNGKWSKGGVTYKDATDEGKSFFTKAAENWAKESKEQNQNSHLYSPLFIPGFANGRIVNGPMVSLIGEAGPEAVIPLGAERRRRGLGLWMQAGEMMGITAEGGKTGYEVSPLGGSVPLSISLGGMNFTINGTDTANGESIVAAIRAQLPNVTNEIAAMLSQLLSDSYSNMTLQAAG